MYMYNLYIYICLYYVYTYINAHTAYMYTYNTHRSKFIKLICNIYPRTSRQSKPPTEGLTRCRVTDFKGQGHSEKRIYPPVL